jgi:hypothetical protein
LLIAPVGGGGDGSDGDSSGSIQEITADDFKRTRRPAAAATTLRLRQNLGLGQARRPWGTWRGATGRCSTSSRGCSLPCRRSRSWRTLPRKRRWRRAAGAPHIGQVRGGQSAR